MSDSLYIGWVPAVDIATALHRIPAEQLDGCFALISMVDSTPRVRTLQSLVPLLRSLGHFLQEVDDDVVIEASSLLTLIDEHEFFSGFDEVWIFREIPRSGKPEGVRITSDTPLRATAPPGLARWMRETRCVAGLGDGDGLNFVTFDPALAALWQE